MENWNIRRLRYYTHESNKYWQRDICKIRYKNLFLALILICCWIWKLCNICTAAFIFGLKRARNQTKTPHLCQQFTLEGFHSNDIKSKKISWPSVQFQLKVTKMKFIAILLFLGVIIGLGSQTSAETSSPTESWTIASTSETSTSLPPSGGKGPCGGNKFFYFYWKNKQTKN